MQDLEQANDRKTNLIALVFIGVLGVLIAGVLTAGLWLANSKSSAAPVAAKQPPEPIAKPKTPQRPEQPDSNLTVSNNKSPSEPTAEPAKTTTDKEPAPSGKKPRKAKRVKK